MPNAFNLTETNPWLGFSLDDPQGTYGAFLPKTDNTFLSNYLKNQYGNIYGDYNAELNKQALSGQAPSMEWANYLQGYPFLSAWYKMSPNSRGENTSGSLPGLKWNV